MGFRSTFTIEDYNIQWPEWFVEKYEDCTFFNDNNKGVIAAKHESKTYGNLSGLGDDIQRAINWDDFKTELVLVFLHECGGITRVEISRDEIVYTEPTEWRRTEGVEHDYCYGCSSCNRALRLNSI